MNVMKKQQFIDFNREKAEKWLRECPKTHRLKKYVQTVEKFTRGELVIDKSNTVYSLEFGDYTVGSRSNRHYRWMPRVTPHCELWQIDEAAQKLHDAEIHALRHDTPHCTVYSDIGSLRIIADGVKMYFGGVGGDGEHRVFFTERHDWNEETVLSLFGRVRDEFICTFHAKHLKVFICDCTGDGRGDEVVFEMKRETPQAFNVYNVYDNLRGWKIEHCSFAN